jgi:SAM-dependent methyltransferase
LTAVSPSVKARALELFAGIPAEYDAAGALLSFGQGPRWRRAPVAAVALAPTDRVLDVATGTGLVAAALIERHGCSVVGVDRSEEMLARARARQRTDRSFAALRAVARRGRAAAVRRRLIRCTSPISFVTSTIPRPCSARWPGS